MRDQIHHRREAETIAHTGHCPAARRRLRLVRSTTSPNRPRLEEKLMNLTLWIVAGLLAALSAFSGATKVLLPKSKLDRSSDWTANVSAGFIKTIGGLEILAAAGLILPAALDIAPVMVPVTALCWMLLMIGGMITHARYGQYKYVALCFALLVVASFVAWGRFGPESFTG